MKEYFVWATVLTSAYEGLLLTALINRGYTVSSASEAGSVNADTYNSAALFGLKVSKNGLNHQQIHSEVIDIFQSFNGYYYSIIVAESSHEAIWMSTNIAFNEPVPNTIPTKKKELN